ncbi:hypothetical protein ABIA35_002314 [Catenulispora sp. MAP12-49]
MVAKPVIIGDVYFPRKGDAQQACRDLLYRYPPGSVIDDPSDEAFLHDLLELHQDAAGKRGVGIDHFEVRLTEEFHQPGFFIIRVDGTVTDFSFLRCLTPATHRDRVLTAMRRAVKDQVVAFKQEALAEDGTAVCAITDAVVTAADIHVDHHDPDFLALAQDYAAEHGGFEAFGIVNGDGVIGAEFADPATRDAWAEHHRDSAQLQITSVQANLSLRRRRRHPGSDRPETPRE